MMVGVKRPNEYSPERMAKYALALNHYSSAMPISATASDSSMRTPQLGHSQSARSRTRA